MQERSQPLMLKNPRRWYALYTTPRSEKQVHQRLQLAGIEVFLPIHSAPRKWSDRIKYVETPLFSSYIFVRTSELQLRSLLKVNGVVRIVFHAGAPAVIRDREINAIRDFLEKAREKELMYEIGQELLIACGPLKDISGKIKKINKTQLILHLEQLGCTVAVKIDQVVKKRIPVID
jgi:transcription antitermination factor NusG